MSGRTAPQPAWAKHVAVAAVPAVVSIPGQIIRTSAGVAGMTGLVPRGAAFAVAFTTWVPLVVIFGLLTGEQLARMAGVLIAIPVVVVVKEAVVLASERLGSGTAVAAARAPATAPARAVGPRTREIPARAIDAPGLRPER